MKNALLVVNFNDMITPNQRASFEHAASKWKVDYIEITETDLQVNYHTGAVKLLAFELCKANRICILDADTIVRIDTPSPFVVFSEKAFTAVVNKQLHMPTFYQYAADQIQPKEIELIMQQYPVFVFDYTKYFNTGFLMVHREHHSLIFERASEIFLTVTGLGWWDQSPLNYTTQESGEPLFMADTTWNYCMPPVGMVMEKYIYHFAGIPTRREILEVISWR